MKLVPMRFKGYTWHHNPKSIVLKNKKKSVTLSVPYSSDVMQFFGEKPVEISGSGELYGSDCLEQYERLYELYLNGESGILCLPDFMPVYASFDKLSMEASDKKDVLTYNFTFANVRKKAKSEPFDTVLDVSEGDTLFDMSARYDVDIETLVKLNADIMFINDLSDTKQVRIC